MFAQKVFVSVFVLLCAAASVCADRPLGPGTEARSVRIGGIELTWNDAFVITRPLTSREYTVIAEDKQYFYSVAGRSESSGGGDLTVSVVIGPIIGLHWSSGQSSRGDSFSYQTLDLSSGKAEEADLRVLFDETDIVDAIVEQTGVELASEATSVETIEQLKKDALELPCQIRALSPGHWMVLEVQKDVATVEILEYRCRWEANVVLAIPIPEDRRAWFDEAVANGTVGEAMRGDTAVGEYRALEVDAMVPRAWDMIWFPEPTHVRGTSTSNSVVNGNIRWNNLEASVWRHDREKPTWQQIYADSIEYREYAWSRDDVSVVDHEMVSIVGPLVSFLTAKRERTGLASRESFEYVTVDSLDRSRTPVRITEIFPEEDVVAALMEAPDFRRLVADESATSVQEIVIRDDRCGVLGKLATSWAIMDLEEERAVVRFVLGSKKIECGRYTEIFEIRLPVPEEWRKPFSDAKRSFLLGRDLPRKGFRVR